MANSMIYCAVADDNKCKFDQVIDEPKPTIGLTVVQVYSG